MRKYKDKSLETFDLNNIFPSDVLVTGLSKVQFDGKNFFRIVENPESQIIFNIQSMKFVQLKLQLYSPISDVTGIMKLDGKVISIKSFSQKKFSLYMLAGEFASPGMHKFAVEYKCGSKKCPFPLSQYATQLTLVSPNPENAVQNVGISTQRWWLDAPSTPLNVLGVGPLYFDGDNYLRQITQNTFHIIWKDTGALSATMRIYTPNHIKVTTRIENRVVSIQTGDKNHPVFQVVSLVKYPKVRSFSVTVDCLNQNSTIQATNANCAYLYSPQLSVNLGVHNILSQRIIACGAVVLLIIVLWRYLELKFALQDDIS